MKPRKIRGVKVMRGTEHTVEVCGWFQGQKSYLWFGLGNGCVGTLSGKPLRDLVASLAYEFRRPR